MYTESLRDSTKKLLDLINEFGKTAEYKVNIWKSKALFYTVNEVSETEIRGKIAFIIAAKKNRNKLNQGGRRPIFRKLYNTEERK